MCPHLKPVIFFPFCEFHNFAHITCHQYLLLEKELRNMGLHQIGTTAYSSSDASAVWRYLQHYPCLSTFRLVYLWGDMCISFVTSLGRASIEYVILFIYLFILRVNLNSSKGTGRSFSPKVNRGRGEKINTKYCENVKWHNSLEWELRQPPCAHKKATLPNKAAFQKGTPFGTEN